MNNSKIKICILHSTLHIGGAEEVTANICKTIDKDLFDITVCYLKEMGLVGERIAKQGTDVIGVAKKSINKTDYLTSLRLRNLIKKEQFSIVHTHDIHSLIDASICRLTMPSLKLVHTFHFGNYPHREPKRAKLEKLFWRVPDKLVSVSEKQKSDLCKFYKIPENRVTTVWNGVDILTENKKLDAIEGYRQQGKVIIGSVNTLIEQKGMFDLIEVSKVLKDNLPDKFVFVVAGDGPLRSKLEAEIAKYNLEDYVHLLGWVDSASSVILPKIDIFFQPSLWEAMSMVLLEAMASSKAIVTTSVGETPKIINSPEYGVVVEPGNIQAMISSLTEMIEKKQLREQLGKNARLRYEEHFTAAKMSSRYADLYQKLINV
ncbi:glycosyltransferase family 4 protein [Candidatus Thiodiazotropha sp. CDECU1]|uniref:glycosyltransferase family 4 protein n=1 Tax=Candidatus Thiodiazotropha sp. CDECU1 TaxID=3065865 RepID=UPI002930C71B|nr:glycosyltransferase family 4 protein [Candidatus Thiodiazotropha sp. CDECU1]